MLRLPARDRAGLSARLRMRRVLAAAAVLVAVLLGVVLTGFALPVAHVASRSIHLERPPDGVMAILADVENFPRWRTGVEAVEVLAWEPHLRWREHGGDTLTFERVEIDPPRRLVTRIADPNLPFGGRWTFELAPEGSGTRLTLTEDGEVYNPLYRFMSRFVFGHDATIGRFLDDLQARLGERSQGSRMLPLRHAPVAQVDRASAF
jgi:hypothetical protein